MKFLDILIVIPEFFFINIIITFLWLGLYLRYFSPSHLWAKTFGYYSVFTLFIVIILFCNTPLFSSFCFNGAFVSTAGTTFLKVFIAILSVLIFFSSIDAEKGYKNFDAVLEVWFIRLLVIVSLFLLVSSNDLIWLFFSLELYALSSYILVGYKGKFSVFSSESALKYFILGTIFSIIFVYGVSIFYMTTGLTHIDDIVAFFNFNTIFANSKFLNITVWATLFIVAGIMFKLAAAPFHFWSPDVYDGAPTSIVLFLSTVPKISLFVVLVKLINIIEIFELSEFLFVSALLSVAIGSVGGLFQKRIKRLLAYSMINNTGFLILAASVATFTSKSFLVFFLIAYLLTLVGTFASILTLRISSNGYLIKNLYGLSNLFFINKSLAFAFIILLFSSAGLPPLVGFLSKFFIFLTLADFNSQLFYVMLLIFIFTPLSVFYYVRIIKIMSFSKRRFWVFLKQPPALTSYVIAFVSLSTVLLFWLSGLLLSFSAFFV